MISVVTPFYNASETISNYLNAFDKQVSKNFEIVLVNDGSTDNSSNIVSEFIKTSKMNIKLINTKNNGPGNARNIAIASSRGDIIAFTDADCVPDKGWISTIYSVYKDRSINLTSGRVTCNDTIIYPWKISPAGQIGITANLQVRRKTLGELNFDSTFNGLLGEDTDLVKRIEKIDKSNKLIYVSEILVLHPINILNLKKVIKRALARSQEVALIKLYGEDAYSSMNIMYRPLIAKVFSLNFTIQILFMVMILSNLILPLLFLILLLITAFQIYGYRSLVHGNTKNISQLDRIKTGYYFVIYNFFITIARIKGSIDNKRLMI